MDQAPRFATPPTLEDIERMGFDALARIPQPWAGHLTGVIVRVEEFSDDETLKELGIATPFDLMGLYRGMTLEQRVNAGLAAPPDMIFLYRRAILDYWCESGEDLAHLVRHVLVHEVGHHFGLTDADMEAIEASME